MATKFIPPITRKEGTAFGKAYHYYEDGEGHRMPGVTTIINDGIPKKKLIGWAANATAEGAVDRWDELAELPPAKRLKKLQGIRYDVTNTAKNKGTLVHGYGARIANNEEVFGVEPELRAHVEAYVRFLNLWQVEPVLIEVTVANYDVGYAGTLDLVADLLMPSGDIERWLLDIKTGETGIYPEVAIQLAAYRNAEVYVAQDGNEEPMAALGIERTGAVHVTADDAVLVPTISGPAEFKTFRAAMHIYGHAQIEDQLILAPMLHPNRSTARIVWGDE